ncbi:MAG: hypothetical protein U0Y68_07340 [Blastocatellia bacterium]
MAVGSGDFCAARKPAGERFGWRWTFVLVGLAGFVWCAVWFFGGFGMSRKPSGSQRSGTGDYALARDPYGAHPLAGRLLFKSGLVGDWRNRRTAFGYGIFFYITCC